MPLEIVALGDAALIVRVGESLDEVLATLHKLEAANLPGVSDIAPALASVAIFLDSPQDFETCAAAIRTALSEKRRGAKASVRPGRIEVPVCYEAEFALDREIVARSSGLPPDEIGRLHAAARYQVQCLGFTPGFPYLAGLPAILATPRRATPRIAVPAGSVAIGGRQAGIYPLNSPGGWNVIGRTPLRLFDIMREPPSLLRTGDQVRFVAISREEFERWGK